MITAKNGRELKVGDIVAEMYYNGYWIGIIEQPEFYVGTVTAVRLLDGDYYFYDFLLDGQQFKHIIKGNNGEWLWLDNIIENPKALDPEYLEYYNAKVKTEHPFAERLKYDFVKQNYNDKTI